MAGNKFIVGFNEKSIDRLMKFLDSNKLFGFNIVTESSNTLNSHKCIANLHLSEDKERLNEVFPRDTMVSELVIVVDFNEDNFDENISKFNTSIVIAILNLFYSHLEGETSVVILPIISSEIPIYKRKDFETLLKHFKEILSDSNYELMYSFDKTIRLNSLFPLYLKEKGDLDKSWMRKLQIRQPLGKFVSFSDIKNTLNFLLSEDSQAIRGQQIILDYGYLD